MEDGRGEKCGRRIAEVYKAKTGVVCDGFHPSVPLELEKETREDVVEFLEKVEPCGRWPQQACTTMSHCACAYDESLVGSLARARGCDMPTKYRIEWDATDGRNGGAERTVGETLPEMERDHGAVWFLTWQRLSSGFVLQCGLGRRTSICPGRSCGWYAVYFEHQRRIQFDWWGSGAARGPSRPVSLGRSEVACLLRNLLQDGRTD